MQTASPTEGAGIGAYSYWRGGGATEVVGGRAGNLCVEAIHLLRG